MSLPIGPKENVVFSTMPFKGRCAYDGNWYDFADSHQPDDQEIQHLFLERRVARRQLRSTGEWGPRSKSREKGDPVKVLTCNVGPEAFALVAKKTDAMLHCDKVFGNWFNNVKNLSHEQMRELLLQAEDEVRKRRRQARTAQLRAA